MKWTLSDKNKRLVIGGFAIIILFFVVLALFKPAFSKKTNSTTRNKSVAADVYSIHKKDLVRKVSLIGQTVSQAQVDIAAKYSGRIVKVNVELGDHVSAGQVLIVQDTADAEIAIAQGYASFRQAQADSIEAQASFDSKYEKAQADYVRYTTNYNRYKTLYENGAVSKDALDTAEQQLITAKSSLNALTNQTVSGTIPASIESKQAAASKAEQYVEALTKQRNDLILTAPRNGVITYRRAEEGSLVQAGQTLMSLIDNSQLYIDCQMSEQDAAFLQQGMETNVSIPSVAKIFSGKIIFISNAKDSTTQTYPVRISLTNPDSTVKSGMYSKTSINVMLKPNTLLVPKDAVLTNNGKNHVYVLNNKNQAEKYEVQIGLRNDDELEILGGIKEGDIVIISNLAKIKPGMSISPTEGNR